VPQRFSSRTSSVSRLTAIPVFVKQSCTHSSFGTSLPGEPVSLIRVISAPEALPGVLHRLFGLSLQPEVLPGVLRHSRGYPQVAACRGSAGDLSHTPAWRGPACDLDVSNHALTHSPACNDRFLCLQSASIFMPPLDVAHVPRRQPTPDGT
jgi:hypothetical protein